MNIKLNKILAFLDVGSIIITFILWYLVYMDTGDLLTTLWLYFHLISLVFIIIYTVFSIYRLIKKKIKNKRNVFIVFGLNTVFVIYALCAVLSIEIMGSPIFL